MNDVSWLLCSSSFVIEFAEPDRRKQCRDAEGTDEGGARDVQAAHPQPQASGNVTFQFKYILTSC